MDLRTALKLGIANLRNANVDSFTLAAELLLLHAIGRDRAWLYTHHDEPLSETEANHYFSWIDRRCAGEPTQHLTGKQEFWGLDFEVTPDVLIPRPETEHLIEVALDRLALREVRFSRPQKNSGEGLLIADIGTGSGCIAIALAKELPAAAIYATDISPAALAVARRNAARNIPLSQIYFLECDLLQNVASVDASVDSSLATRLPSLPRASTGASLAKGHSPLLFDLIVSNPPYVGRREAHTLAREVRDHEPDAALFGGEEGYELYAELIAQAANHLKPGGLLVLELGHNSLPAVQPLLDAANWTRVAVTNDLAGIPRVIAAERL
ncbi:MAG: peptide chain release factor N(5)-glutamine methyltransferase [Candidatus Acidiferrum sp.]